MEKVKQINIKNGTYYFYKDQTNLNNSDARLLKVDKKRLLGYCHLLHWLCDL